MIIDMINGEVKKPFFVYEPELIIRSSCKTFPK